MSFVKETSCTCTDDNVFYLIASQSFLTVVGGCAGRQAAVADLLPAQADLLLELLNLTVTVSLLLALLFPTPQVALHQLDCCNKGLGNAEMGVFLFKVSTAAKVLLWQVADEALALWRFPEHPIWHTAVLGPIWSTKTYKRSTITFCMQVIQCWNFRVICFSFQNKCLAFCTLTNS